MAARKTVKKEVTNTRAQAAYRRRTANSRVSARRTREQVKPRSTALLDYFRFGESYTSLVLGIIVVIIAALLLVSLFKTRSDKTQLVDTQKGTTSISTIAEALKQVTPTAAPIITSIPTTTQVTPTVTQTPTATPTQTVKPTNTPTPTPEKVVTPTQNGQKTYTIKPGDDLWKIAESQYHDGYQWVAIAKANNLTDPGVIHVGNKLVLPKVTPTPTPTSQVAQQDTQMQPTGPKITGNTYVIARGDDLWDISVRAYGTGYKWTELAKVNNISDPNIINVGNKLTIPR